MCDLLQELFSVQGQLERALLDKVKAERAKQHMVDRLDRSWDRALPRFVGSRPNTAGAGAMTGGWASPEPLERGESRVEYVQGGTHASMKPAAAEAAGDGAREGAEGDVREGGFGEGVVRGPKEALVQQQQQQQQQCQQRLGDDTLQQHDKSQPAVVAVA
jgi:hypothetical protein